MALNLSTLTSSATSGDVLAEALTTADFLENVPVLRNLARGSQKGGDAKQDVALNQPKALPLIDGKGYCYLPATLGNAPAVTFPNVPVSTNFVLTIVADIKNPTNFHFASDSGGAERFAIYNNQFYTPNASGQTLNSVITSGHSTFVIERVGSLITLTQNGVVKGSHPTNGSGFDLNHLSFNGQYGTAISPLNGYIQKATLSINGTEELNIDFTATNVRHGDTKFKCATGQVVTINQSGNDPATVIKKSVLRFDGVDDGLKGLFDQTIDGGYMFAAFSVLGGGSWGRVFSINKTGAANDYTDNGLIFSYRSNNTNNLLSYKGGVSLLHDGLFDIENGDILHEVKHSETDSLSKVNSADLKEATFGYDIEGDVFNIGQGTTSGSEVSCIDLEFLALFPATITDAQADSVRNYINNRNNVFDLKDGFGYYFYDATKAPVGPITTGSASWNGRIVGSDNGDSDRYATQGTTNDAPVSDGYVVTFADNTDHLDIPSTTQAGWQIVGTSLGTFVYKVNNTAVTELNLLGNAGSHRSVGDSFGMILLPESATGAHIEAARKLLIDRGAADGVSASSVENYFRERDDMVEFKGVDFSGVTNFVAVFFGSAALTTFDVNSLPDVTSLAYAFRGSGLTSFHTQLPLVTNASNSFYGSNLESFGVQLPEATRVEYAFYNCSSLSDFTTTDIKKCVNFTSAWQNCSALTSFPSGAKLGTSANNVNFTSAWRSSGLTSFSTPLTTTNRIVDGFNSCTSLTDFSANVFANWNPQNMASGVFHDTWKGCTSLTAVSVGNILQSIDASNQHGTDDGTSTGNPLGNRGIDIDYNVATGSLSAATDAAIESLMGKGWQVFINGVLTVPAINNILVLSPAAAYSLRSFDSNDDPNVVNVRRSNDNATSDFTASEVSDGTLVAFVGAGNDGLVTTWYDQSGTNHANQIVASRQPKIVNGGALVTEGGLAALDFDGSNDYLKMTSNVFAENLEVAIVNHLQDGSSSNPRLITLSNGTDDNFMVLHQKSTDYLLLRCHSSEGGATTSSRFGAAGVIDDYNLIYATSKLSSDSYTCSVDGVSQSEVAGPAVGSGSYSISTIGVRSDIFSGSYITGTIQEVIVYDTDQSANRLGIAANINDHFDIYS